MANLSVCASVIPDGVEITSGISSSVYPLTMMVTNYLAPVLSEGSLTPWTEDGQSSLVGSVENSVSNHILYSGLPYYPGGNRLHNYARGICYHGESIYPNSSFLSRDFPDASGRLLRNHKEFTFQDMAN